jgi:hypothetical protein
VKKILVASIYSPSDRNPVWRDLKLRYLDQTLGERNYDHLAWLSGVSPDLFAGTRTIVLSGSQGQSQTDEQLAALQGILGYFVEARNRYEHFMVTDSDTFPFRARWLDRLLDMMRKRSWRRPGDLTATGRLPERLVAAIVQTDHFNVYVHPSAVLIQGTALRADPTCVEFRTEVQRNILGMEFRELVAASKVPVLPLTRTNYWNAHPMLAGVYGDVIYRHGGGPGELFVRVLESGYFDHMITRSDHALIADHLYAALVRDPVTFLDHLAGTNRFEVGPDRPEPTTSQPRPDPSLGFLVEESATRRWPGQP